MIEIFWRGGLAVQVNSREAKFGFNLEMPEGTDLLIYSAENSKVKITENQFKIDSPGEFEIKSVMVYSLITENGKVNKAFQVMADGVSFFYCDNFDYLPTQDQIDTIGTIDVAFLPVGTNKEAENYAKKLVELIDPRIIIPIGSEIETNEKVCHNLAKQLGLKCDEPQKSLKIKSRKDLPEETQEYVVLQKA